MRGFPTHPGLIPSLSVACLLGLLSTQSGCLVIAAAAGTGATVAYVRGDTDVLLDAPPQRVADAAESAMKELQIVVVAKHASAIDSKVTGRTARDTRLIVDARGSSTGASKVSIRAGAFGDGALQGQLLEGIRRHLGLPIRPAEPTPVADAPAARPATQPVVADTR